MIKLLFFTFILISASYSQAASFYVGGDYFKSDINIAGSSTSPSQQTLRIGMEVAEQIALEAQYSENIDSDDLYRFKVELIDSQAVFARFISKEYDEITMDVSLGYATTTMSVNGPIGTYSGTDSYEGFAWGISAEQRLESISEARIRISYQSLYDDGELHIRGYSIGFSYYF